MIKKIYNWIKKKILLFFIGGVAIASTGVVIDNKIITDEEFISDIKITQTLKKQQKKGKYQHIPKTTKDGREYQIDEYELPTGEVGYTITIWKTEGNIEYRKVENYGVLINRATNWILIKDNNNSIDTSIATTT